MKELAITMDWFEDAITQSIVADGLPESFARRMAPGVKEKVIRNMTVKHRTIYPIMIFGVGEIVLIRSDIDANIE